MSEETDIAVLKVQLEQLREEVKTISRNMWGIVVAVTLMLGEFVLNKIAPTLNSKSIQSAIILPHEIMYLVLRLFG